MADELVSRFTATLDELEGLARFAFAEAEWSEPWSGAVQLGPHEELLITNDSGVSRHIERWDPQAVLRLVAAHRGVLELYQRFEAEFQRRWAGDPRSEPTDNFAQRVTLMKVVEDLAAGVGVTEED